MQSSVLCGVRVNMMERRLLLAIGRKATNRIRDSCYSYILSSPVSCLVPHLIICPQFS